MNERNGTVFSIAEDNMPPAGCIVSKQVYDSQNFGISCFSMARETDISAESYSYYKLIIIACGELEAYCTDGRSWLLKDGDSLITPANIPVGMRTETGSVYTELRFKEGLAMKLKDGEIFRLSELVPYQEGRIVNMDLINDPALKFAVMSFDEGTGLSEHAAPGEALIFALDGEAIIGYEGTEHIIKAGENFKFAKNGRHWRDKLCADTSRITLAGQAISTGNWRAFTETITQ